MAILTLTSGQTTTANEFQLPLDLSDQLTVPGPSFTINCESGPIGVSAHQSLKPGRHHIAGVYNGRCIKLFIDGKVISERSGSGNLVHSALPVSIGQLTGGAAGFRGRIDEVTIFDTAASDDSIRNSHR